MKTIPTKTYFLQMLNAPKNNTISMSADLLVVKTQDITLSLYKYLYITVGREWLWINRLLMSDEKLQQLITSNDIEIFILYVDGIPAGFAEIDKSVKNEVELVYFGLLKEFFGQGFGKYFLNWIIIKIWSYKPERFWLHTCENDHKAALAIYQKVGFEIYDEKILNEIIPEKEEISRFWVKSSLHLK